MIVRPDIRLEGLGDEALVERAQAGDDHAFEELAERHSTRLRRTLYRITRDCDAASDAAQEALTRAWQNIHRFEGRSRFSTWVTRIGINEAYGILRRPTEQSLDAEDFASGEVPDWGSLPDEVFESREFLAATAGALAELRPDYRTAVRLRDIEGLSPPRTPFSTGQLRSTQPPPRTTGRGAPSLPRSTR